MTEATAQILQEIAKLNARLDNHDQRSETFRENITESLSAVSKRVETMNHLLTGNGDPKSGLIVRFDRLEQCQERRQFQLKAAITASITAIVTAIYTFAKHSIK